MRIQQGFTLIEILAVLAIVSMVTSLAMGGLVLDRGRNQTSKEISDDFNKWYKRIFIESLIDGRHQRICFTDKKIIMQYWLPQKGWYNSDKFLYMPEGLKVENAATTCSKVLGVSDENFEKKISFSEE